MIYNVVLGNLKYCSYFNFKLHDLITIWTVSLRRFKCVVTAYTFDEKWVTSKGVYYNFNGLTNIILDLTVTLCQSGPKGAIMCFKCPCICEFWRCPWANGQLYTRFSLGVKITMEMDFHSLSRIRRWSRKLAKVVRFSVNEIEQCRYFVTYTSDSWVHIHIKNTHVLMKYSVVWTF